MCAVTDVDVQMRALIKPPGSADVIVSADQDLLVLSPFEGIPIVGPAGFLSLLAAPAAEWP